MNPATIEERICAEYGLAATVIDKAIYDALCATGYRPHTVRVTRDVWRAIYAYYSLMCALTTIGDPPEFKREWKGYPYEVVGRDGDGLGAVALALARLTEIQRHRDEERHEREDNDHP